MGAAVNVIEDYPNSVFDIEVRRKTKTVNAVLLARQFGKDYFDGESKYGYGGYTYHQRTWLPVAEKIQKYFDLQSHNTVLDVGCAKGFLLQALATLLPQLTVKGIDISRYAITNAVAQMKPHLQAANANAIPFPDNYFDVVLSFNTLHNLNKVDCVKALAEIQRVSKGRAFVVVAAYQSEQQQIRLHDWNLTAKTIAHVREWKALFHKAGYTGDYYWFFP